MLLQKGHGKARIHHVLNHDDAAAVDRSRDISFEVNRARRLGTAIAFELDIIFEQRNRNIL